MKNLKLLFHTWAISMLLLLVPAVTHASGNLTIVVKNPDPYTDNQSWFNFVKNPGETISDVAEVKNLGDQPVKAHVYPVDATSNDSGSFILKLETEPRTGIGKWTKLDISDTVTIPPKQSVDFPFHIDVPSDATPGQYFGGLVLEEIDGQPQTIQIPMTSNAITNGDQICCTNILVKTRIGLRIYLTIPGAINDKMEWLGFNTNDQNKNINFQFDIQNSGNVGLEPTATISIYDGMGNQVDRFQKSLGLSLPGTTINPIVTWDHQPLFGNFKATAQLSYQIKSAAINTVPVHGSSETLTKTVNFSVIPWDMIFVALACLVFIIIIFGWHHAAAQKISLKWQPYKIQPGDNIMNIAQSYGVDWKKLARVNKLKPPYLLKTEGSLKVPKNKPAAHQTSLFDETKHENK